MGMALEVSEDNLPNDSCIINIDNNQGFWLQGYY